MSANSKPKPQTTVSNLLKLGRQPLVSAGIKSSQIDAEIILAHTLNVGRTWLRSHDQDPVPNSSIERYMNLIKRRALHEPVAYITSTKEFYGRDFKVTSDTLIPRPESEDIITFLKEAAKSSTISQVVDIGTGSGALAISANLELPSTPVLATDISSAALEVAESNALNLHAKIEFKLSDLLSDIELGDNTALLANLPYVNRDWSFLSKDIAFEPDSALFAADNGLELIFKLLDQITASSANNILLILESDTSQQPRIESKLSTQRYKILKKSDYVIAALKP